MRVSLTQADLVAIKRVVDTSIDERTPIIIDRQVQPMLDKLESRLTKKITDLEDSNVGALEDIHIMFDTLQYDVKELKGLFRDFGVIH
jgi:hypothetical protein